MIDKDIYYSLIVLSTSPLSVFFNISNKLLRWRFFFFRMQIVFSNKDNELQWVAWVSLSGRLKDLGEGGTGTPHNGLYGEAPLEKGTFFRLQEYKRVEILLVEVYERVGKSVI